MTECVICGHGHEVHRYGIPVTCAACPDEICQDGDDGRAYRTRQIYSHWEGPST